METHIVHKKCYRCKKVKQLSEFTKDVGQRDGHNGCCKSCASEKYKICTAKNGSYIKIRSRDQNYLNKYGLEKGGYDKLLKKQSSRCGICGFPPILKTLVVDHCHETGKVRGLLCDNCNKGIGFLRDDPDMLRSAIAWIENNSQ